MTKQKIVDVIQRMPEDGTIDDAIDRLTLLKAVAEGLKEAEEGELYDHDDVFNELLNDDAQIPNQVQQGGKNGPARAKKAHRKNSSQRRSRVRGKAKAGNQ